MSEQQPIVKAVKQVKKAATATIAKPKATHPTFFIMISEALKALNEPRSGSSRQGIIKYIMSTYGLEEKFVNTHTKLALKMGVKSGNLKQVKGVGASGSFKLGDVAKKQVTKKVLIKPKEAKVVKKPAVVKSTVKKTATAAKTSPKKIKIIVKKVAAPKATAATTATIEEKPKKTIVKKVVVVKAKAPAKPTAAKPTEAKKVVAKPAAPKTKTVTAKPAAAKAVVAKVASAKKTAVATKTKVVKKAAPKTKKTAPKLQANL
jgi:histone H1/5